MCEICKLVQRAVRGEIPKEQIYHLHDYFIIMDAPDGKGKIVIYRTHKAAPLQMFIDTMADKAVELFPKLRIWYNSAHPPAHFHFKLKPLPKGAKR